MLLTWFTLLTGDEEDEGDEGGGEDEGHIASKSTIVSKFYQIVRVEKCALNTNNTIPTQSIILSDHVVGKMCI